MYNIKEYENKVREAYNLLNNAHSQLTIGNISLKDALKIYNLIFLASKKIENAADISPNIRYFIAQNKDKFLNTILSQIIISFLLGPLRFIVFPFIIKSLSNTFDNAFQKYYQEHQDFIKLCDYFVLKDDFLGLKVLKLINEDQALPQMEENIRNNLINNALKAISTIYFYVYNDELLNVNSIEKEMVIYLLQDALNSNNDNMMELLNEMKESAPKLTRAL